MSLTNSGKLEIAQYARDSDAMRLHRKRKIEEVRVSQASDQYIRLRTYDARYHVTRNLINF